MLLCNVSELEAGWIAGAAVRHPTRPDLQLVSAGKELTPRIIERVRKLGIERVWVQASGTDDLALGAGDALTSRQRELRDALVETITEGDRTTISSASMSRFKQAVNELLCDAIANRRYASLVSRLQEKGPDGLFAHGASVAYLSLVAGIELEQYIISERSRLPVHKAKDHSGLGLAGLLHDVGKSACDEAVQGLHEAHGDPACAESPYRDHTDLGFAMLESAGGSSAVRVAVRTHHLRWDGSGWPDARSCGLADDSKARGEHIHIFARIVAACNTLDNLLTQPEKGTLPVRALARFASTEFDGWFDPVVRRALLRIVQPFAVGSRVVLDDGTPCAVIEPDLNQPCLPIVRPLSAEGADIAEPIALARPGESRRIAKHEGQCVAGAFYTPGSPVDPAGREAA